MKCPTRFAISAATAIILCTSAWSADSTTSLPSDQSVDVNGFELACTGIGDEAQNDPRWKAFPVRLEFAGGRAQYLADVKVTVTNAAGTELFKVQCDSPWLLAKLQPGKYQVRGDFRGIQKTSNFMAPKKGQARIIVRYPEVVGSGDN
ncbi:MAG: hypothetical protein ABL973_02895 [Micropepsaceae bacterium]